MKPKEKEKISNRNNIRKRSKKLKNSSSRQNFHSREQLQMEQLRVLHETYAKTNRQCEAQDQNEAAFQK